MRLIIDTLGQQHRTDEPFLIVQDLHATVDSKPVATGYHFIIKNEIVAISKPDAERLARFLTS